MTDFIKGKLKSLNKKTEGQLFNRKNNQIYDNKPLDNFQKKQQKFLMQVVNFGNTIINKKTLT
jgi:hypothetical protein